MQRLLTEVLKEIIMDGDRKSSIDSNDDLGNLDDYERHLGDDSNEDDNQEANRSIDSLEIDITEANKLFKTTIFTEGSDFVKQFTDVVQWQTDVQSTVDEILFLLNDNKIVAKVTTKLKNQFKRLKNGLASCIDEIEETREEMFYAARRVVEMSKRNSQKLRNQKGRRTAQNNNKKNDQQFSSEGNDEDLP